MTESENRLLVYLDTGQKIVLPNNLFEIKKNYTNSYSEGIVRKEIAQNRNLFTPHGPEAGLLIDKNSVDSMALEKVLNLENPNLFSECPEITMSVQCFLNLPESQIQGNTYTRSLSVLFLELQLNRFLPEDSRRLFNRDLMNLYAMCAPDFILKYGCIIVGPNVTNIFRYLMLSVSLDITTVHGLSHVIQYALDLTFSIDHDEVAALQQKEINHARLFQKYKLTQFLGFDPGCHPLYGCERLIEPGLLKDKLTFEILDPDEDDEESDKRDSWVKNYIKKPCNYLCKAGYGGLPFQIVGFSVVLGASLAAVTITGRIELAMLLGSKGTKLLAEVLSENNVDFVGASTWSSVKEKTSFCIEHFKQWLSK